MNKLISRFMETFLRLLPHAAPTGLLRIGNPGPEDPVLVTGNYTLTIRRMRQALKGIDAWLLAANSKGINVWCAAGGGHLTHHDIISVVRTSRIADQVTHRRLILPQLGATGIERAKIAAATGWESDWGPARLEDLPGYLDRKRHATTQERFVAFPLWERLEMAWIWLLPLLALGLPVAYFSIGLRGTLSTGLTIALMAWSLFTLTPWLPLRGSRRWVTFGVFGLISALFGTVLLMVLGEFGLRSLAIHSVSGSAASWSTSLHIRKCPSCAKRFHGRSLRTSSQRSRP